MVPDPGQLSMTGMISRLFYVMHTILDFWKTGALFREALCLVSAAELSLVERFLWYGCSGTRLICVRGESLKLEDLDVS